MASNDIMLVVFVYNLLVYIGGICPSPSPPYLTLLLIPGTNKNFCMQNRFVVKTQHLDHLTLIHFTVLGF